MHYLLCIIIHFFRKIFFDGCSFGTNMPPLFCFYYAVHNATLVLRSNVIAKCFGCDIFPLIWVYH